MKTTYSIAILAAMLICSIGYGQKQGDSLTPQQIDQIINEVNAAAEPLMSGWPALDADKALQCYSAEMVCCYDTLLLDYQQYAKGWKDMAQSASSVQIVTIKSDNIVLTQDCVISTWVGRVEYFLKSGDRIYYNPIRYTDVWKKANGQWKIFFEQSTGIPVTRSAEKK
jgi:hypothetical protein